MSGGFMVEVFPSSGPDGAPIIVSRLALPPRDLASSSLLAVFALLALAQVAVAIAALVIARVHLEPYSLCLLEDQPDQQRDACTLTYVASGLTIPICAAVMALELLPARLVSPGVRNLVPLALHTLGCIAWGVEAATVHSNAAAAAARGAAAVPLRRTAGRLAWANMSLFLVAAVTKLLSPALSSAIEFASVQLGQRLCPEGCLPASDACCCLDVRTAKVPREVLRHGRPVVRFLSWNQELVQSAPGHALHGAAVPPVLVAMARGGADGGGGDASYGGYRP